MCSYPSRCLPAALSWRRGPTEPDPLPLKNDGYARSCRLGSKCGGWTAGCENHRNSQGYKLGRKRGEPLVMSFSPAIINQDVLADDVSAFTEPLAKCGHHRLGLAG